MSFHNHISLATAFRVFKRHSPTTGFDLQFTQVKYTYINSYIDDLRVFFLVSRLANLLSPTLVLSKSHTRIRDLFFSAAEENC